METEFGYYWDICWDNDLQQDVVMVDQGDTVIYLSGSDADSFLEALDV